MLLRSLAYFRPTFPLQFDYGGRMLLYTTPSATVPFKQTFLRLYAPINIGFVLVHGYLSFAEFFSPLVQGQHGYLYMSSSLTVLGLALAGTVEYYARRFVKTIHLLDDGKHLHLTFHSSYTVKDKQNHNQELLLDIAKCKGIQTILQKNFRMRLENTNLFLNLHRNEVQDQNKLEILNKVLNGIYINTLGGLNINKLKKH